MSIILIEGADGTGKTTLAKEFAKIVGEDNCHYMHQTYDPLLDMVAYHDERLEEALERSEEGKLVIMDRLFLSEVVYGSLFRNGIYPEYNADKYALALEENGAAMIISHFSDFAEAEEAHRVNSENRKEMFKYNGCVNSAFKTMLGDLIDDVVSHDLKIFSYNYKDYLNVTALTKFCLQVLDSVGYKIKEDDHIADSLGGLGFSVTELIRPGVRPDFISDKTATETWLGLVDKVLYNGDICYPRDMKIKEVLEHTTVFSMEYPEVSVNNRNIGSKFRNAEAWWMLSGRNDVKSIKPYSKHIANYSNDGRFFDGAYGPKIVDQLRYVADNLTADQDSRQAYISIWRPSPGLSKDIPCTVGVQFTIRGGYLNVHDKMRSNDIWMGWVYDVFNFSMLGLYVALMLRERGIDVKLGNIYLTSTSSHLYESHWQQAQEISILNSLGNLDQSAGNQFLLEQFSSPEDLVTFLGVRKDNPTLTPTSWGDSNGTVN